jgi:hypothetical protein
VVKLVFHLQVAELVCSLQVVKLVFHLQVAEVGCSLQVAVAFLFLHLKGEMWFHFLVMVFY